MSSTKHTPRPWREQTVTIISFEGDPYHSEECVEVQSASGETVAYIPVAADGDSYLPGKANARLIASAPTNPHDCGDTACPGYREWLKYKSASELLEACRMAHSTFLSSIGGKWELYVLCMGTIEVLEQAIAKAGDQ